MSKARHNGPIDGQRAVMLADDWSLCSAEDKTPESTDGLEELVAI